MKKVGPNGCEQCYFFRYTLSPTFSCRFGTVTFPSVEAMMIVLPVEEGPNSFERSTLIVNIDPSMLISTFFMIAPFQYTNGDHLSPQQRSSSEAAHSLANAETVDEVLHVVRCENGHLPHAIRASERRLFRRVFLRRRVNGFGHRRLES